jgi:hypothetical protein
MTDRDGKVATDGNTTIYEISANTETKNSFREDYKKIAVQLKNDINRLELSDIITTTKDYKGPDDFAVSQKKASYKIEGSKDVVKFSDNNEKNFFLIFAQTILTKKEDFYNQLIKTPEDVGRNSGNKRVEEYNKFKKMVMNCLDARFKLYSDEQKNDLNTFNVNRKEATSKVTGLWDENKDRIFDYKVMESPSTDDRSRLRNILYFKVNYNNNKKTFNGKKIFN